MNGLIAWFASNPVAANLLMLFIVVAGLLSATQLRQEPQPNVSFDTIHIGVAYPGASPSEVERSICVRIEEAIHAVRGIKRLFSRADEGYGSVWAHLENDADVRRVREDIETEIDALQTLPRESDPPVVRELIDDSVLIGIAVHGRVGERTLRAVGERIREGISDLDEVDRAELLGVRPYEIAIEVSEADLRRHGLAFDDVTRHVRASSLDLPGGSLRTPAGEILVRAQGQAYRGPEFERLVLLTREDGTRLRLGEVATVTDGFAETDEKVRLDGEPAAIVRVMTSERENVLVVAEAVQRYVTAVRETLPRGVSITIWHDQSRSFESRRDLLLRNGAGGLALILAILALFLRPRVAGWVSLGIPISFLGGMLVLWLTDVSINMMSLFAFIVALGLVVDDAIIVGENGAGHQARSGDRLAGAIRGAQEVAVPVLVAVLTTIFFVAPTLRLPGVVGKIAFSLGVVVIGCLAFSLVEALFVLPSHLVGRDLVGHGEEPVRRRRGAPRGLASLQRRADTALGRFVAASYQPFLSRCLRWPALTVSVAGVSLMLAVAGLYGGWVRYAFFPEIENELVRARLVMPQGTPPALVEAAAAHIEAEALALAAEVEREAGGRQVVENVMVAIGDPPDTHDDFGGGGDPPHVAHVRLGLVPGEARQVSSLEIESRWRERVGPVPGAVELHFEGSDLGDVGAIDLSLAGVDRDVLRRAARALAGTLATYPGVRDIADSEQGGKTELVLRIRPEAEALGLSLAELARQVRQGFHGEEVQRIQRGRDDVPVVVRYPPEERRSLRDLESVWIRVPGGGELPFSAVAVAEVGRGTSAIERRDRKSQISVVADVDPAVTSANEVLARLEAEALPELLARFPGVEYDIFGVSQEEGELLGSLSRGWLLALVASYALLAVALRSYAQPLLILAAVPFGFAGAVAAHAVLGLAFSSFSMIGLVALTGVVVNDALVLIDRVNRRRDEGAELFAALLDAGAARFRPIVLTSLTTFFGLLPLLFERSAQAQWLKPMAVTLGFGVLFATGITLLLVPAAYVLLDTALARPPDAAAQGRSSLRGARPEPQPVRYRNSSCAILPPRTV